MNQPTNNQIDVQTITDFVFQNSDMAVGLKFTELREMIEQLVDSQILQAKIDTLERFDSKPIVITEINGQKYVSITDLKKHRAALLTTLKSNIGSNE